MGNRIDRFKDSFLPVSIPLCQVLLLRRRVGSFVVMEGATSMSILHGLSNTICLFGSYIGSNFPDINNILIRQCVVKAAYSGCSIPKSLLS